MRRRYIHIYFEIEKKRMSRSTSLLMLLFAVGGCNGIILLGQEAREGRLVCINKA